jgi:4-aminobutyrate aminotransferase-like enzyme/aminoglycoside phosphotransferase (APT) family kinase protein
MLRVKYNLPTFTEQVVGRFVQEYYGLRGVVRPLPSERDQNFYLQAEDGREFVLKIANVGEQLEILDLQNKAMEHLTTHAATLAIQRVCPTKTGESIASVMSDDGRTHFMRLLTFLPGEVLARVNPHSPELLRSLGRVLATIDNALMGFTHPAARRKLKWDLQHADWIREYIRYIERFSRRAIVERFLFIFEEEVKPKLAGLRAAVIYNDANDYNLLVGENDAGAREVIGVIDFGDMVHTNTICELAVGAAYAMLSKPDPIAAAAEIVAGYHGVFPLFEEELEVLYPLICARLAVSVTNSAYQRTVEPGNEYLTVSEQPAWELIERLTDVSLEAAFVTFRRACGSRVPKSLDYSAAAELSAERILEIRARRIGKSLSVSYEKPLKIVRGWMQYLYDENGSAYLDAVNNVAHVGHCHPRVVKAGQEQMAVLNTNTRYLHENLVVYAEQLCAKLPEPLGVCFFVNSGSEANELALRLARAHTKRKDIIVVDGAYHGNTTSLIEISPYKFDGPGGAGAPPYVHKVPTPDVYRGLYKQRDMQTGEQYADHVSEAIRQVREQGDDVGAFICESLMSCAGQIVLPENYLQEVYRHVRAAGGVCIADEVQVGFGRVGTHFWGFETQGVVPDIVTMGKPIGNGHPLGAVVTTKEIADSFANGMEYFNTYGGNPVSCAIGLTVLDVIAEEQLRENALTVGAHLLTGLRKLMEKHSLIGDVRGLGLFIGVELVLDRRTLEPASARATYVVNRMRECGVLMSTDGPLHNVLKIKPPLVFTEANADSLVATLDKILGEDSSGS